MSVFATPLPRGSKLNLFRRSRDFVDCYRADGVSEELSFYDAAMVALTEAPVWARYLLKLRNILVRPLGLKVGEVYAPVDDRGGQLLPGDKCGVFNVYSHTENEMILGEDDKHLDFRVSLYREGSSMYMATWVQPHNALGWTYLTLILPFHKVIVRNNLARMELK